MSPVLEIGAGTGNLTKLFFFQAEDGIRDADVTGQTCALPIFGPIPGVARYHDIQAPGQGAAERFPGFAAHDDGAAQRTALEVRQIARQPPRKAVVATDDAVAGVGDDDLYEGSGRHAGTKLRVKPRILRHGPRSEER